MSTDRANETWDFQANLGSATGDHGVTEVSNALVGTRFGDIRRVARTGSTNSDVLRMARDGAPEGVVLVADHQDEGRGRRGRAWVDRPGSSLLVSVLLRPPAPLAGMATIAVGVAMAEAVEEVAGFAPGLKWPNDLVVSGEDEDRKLAGILAETDWPPGTNIAAGWREPAPYERAAVIAGVGVNVTWPARPPGGEGAADRGPDPEPAGALPLDPVAVEGGTALNWVAGREIDRADLLVAFLHRLESRYGTMVRDRSAGQILEEWKRRSATLGRRVRVDLGTEDVEGEAVAVTDRGHLVVETLEGDRRALAVGDIVHLRAR